MVESEDYCVLRPAEGDRWVKNWEFESLKEILYTYQYYYLSLLL